MTAILLLAGAGVHFGAAKVTAPAGETGAAPITAQPSPSSAAETLTEGAAAAPGSKPGSAPKSDQQSGSAKGESARGTDDLDGTSHDDAAGKDSATPAPAAPSTPPTTASGVGAGSAAAPAPAANPAPASRPAAVSPPPASTSATGVPAGTALKRHDGDLVIRTPGTVIDGLDIRGFVRVEAPNVTIRNSIIRGRDTTGDAILIYAGTGKSAGLVVHDTELVAQFPSHRVNGVYGYGFTLTRVAIHNVIDSVHIFGNDVVIQKSWLHDNLHYANDPGWNGGPSHDDSIQIQKGSNIVITGNAISGAYNAALQITQDQGTVSQVSFTSNLVSGGGCTINVAEKGKGAIKGLTISNNIFGGSRFGCSALIPPTTTATMSGNTKSDGTVVRVDRRAQ
ncbi:right-handed parallel beta-helix repeat-containing protein [Homoserinimonas hongtaonis]|uniref:right-handed parallel beta-helix repeat-containing protein n=1 Tax=Homoserinimonas hongtaonis TaxID=2079791 RepID=UPI001304A6D4|nr:right-handed parallel beta-helix repeat-containing protein [Salinibacterium hongtaonis]